MENSIVVVTYIHIVDIEKYMGTEVSIKYITYCIINVNKYKNNNARSQQAHPSLNHSSN